MGFAKCKRGKTRKSIGNLVGYFVPIAVRLPFLFFHLRYGIADIVMLETSLQNAKEETMIYVASSWRNQYQDLVVQFLRQMKFTVYDFKNPAPNETGFNWKQIDDGWESWSFSQYKQALDHPISIQGYRRDFYALEQASSCVLVLPCGRSAHLEAGYMIGQRKPTVIYIPQPETIEPELMYKLADGLTNSLHELAELIKIGES